MSRFLLLGLLLGPGLGSVASATSVEEQADSSHIAASILNVHCVRCHGPAQQLSGLRLDTRKSVREGGYSGPSIILGDSGGSTLVQRIISERKGYRMPPGSLLP